MEYCFSLRIDWSELDLFGHVNNVAFFRYVQAARLSFCEKTGISALNEPGKPGFMVASSACNFRKPLYYPGEVKVCVKCDWTRNTSFQLSYRLFNDAGELVAEASDVLVLYDYEQKCKLSISSALQQLLCEQDQQGPSAGR